MAEAPVVAAPNTGRGAGWWLGWLVPVIAARRLCRPSRHDRIDDPSTRTVQRLRAGAGFVVVLGVALAYDLTDATEAVTQPWIQVFQNCGMLVVLVPIVSGIFIRSARPDLRRGYLRRTRGPAAVLGVLVGLVVVLVLMTMAGQGTFGTMSPLWALLGLWAMIFGLVALLNSVANVFRTADVHEVLPPLVSMVLVWANLLVDLVGDKYGEAPENVASLLLYGGPVTVTVLALWELRRLRTRHGLTVRGALGR